MTNLKILVCDDLARRGKEWEAKIKKATGKSSVGLYAKEFLDVLTVFDEKAVNPALARKKESLSKETYFDEFDIVVIDNNLGELKIGGLRPTAETIARDIRAFSGCGYVVSVNKAPKIDFDLKHLFGDLDTKADIVIKGAHLDSKWLWNRTMAHEEVFRPWYWSCLSEAPERRRKQIGYVAANLDESIKEALNIPDNSIGDIPRASQSDFWAGAKKFDFAKVTFRQFFVHGIRSFDERDRLIIAKKDVEGVATTMARIITAELEQWLRLNLLAPQTALVDVPHLIEREPAIRKGKGFVDIIRKSGKLETFSDELLPPSFERYRFKPDFWLPIPAYWWKPLRMDGELQDLRNKFDDSRMIARTKVFCEDTSDFQDITEDKGPASFFCGFDTAYDKRFVTDVSGRTYHPRTLLVS